MWDRKELKKMGKAAFRANYWKCVLTAFLMLILLGGGLGVLNNRINNTVNWNGNLPREESPVTVTSPSDDLTDALPKESNDPVDMLPPEIQQVIEAHESHEEFDFANAYLLPILLAVGAIVGIMVLLCSIVDILVMNPLEVGCKRFFVRNSEAPADLNEIGAGFDNWGNNVKTMFLKDLFLFLWGLLLIIPGIVKSYSYRMVPYILADHPEMGGTEVLTLSKRMMMGHKWKTFVLDLSFLGWDILSGLTASLLGIFYVNPYKHATNAELYRALRGTVGL